MKTSHVVIIGCLSNLVTTVHDEQWNGDMLAERLAKRLERSMDVAMVLSSLTTGVLQP